MKLCKHCKYFSYEYNLCTHPRALIKEDPINGVDWHETTVVMRALVKYCGPEAVLYKRKYFWNPK